MMTTGSMAMNFPSVPSTQNRGMNATMVVVTVPTTGQATSAAPPIAASKKSSPVCIRA